MPKETFRLIMAALAIVGILVAVNLMTTCAVQTAQICANRGEAFYLNKSSCVPIPAVTP